MNDIQNGAVIVSWAFDPNNPEKDLLIVGNPNPGRFGHKNKDLKSQMNIINAYLGAEARELYSKLAIRQTGEYAK